MADRVNVDFGTISKRSRCINPVSESVKIDSEKRFRDLNSKLKTLSEGGCKNNPSIKNLLNSFMESISNGTNANKFFRRPLYLIQEFNRLDPEVSSELVTEYTTNVLPYLQDFSTMKEVVDLYNLNVEQKKQILESATKYKAADRILRNHEKISKRFNILQEVSNLKYKGLQRIVESCCAMIDTYTLAPYAKMNLCFEELSYLLDKTGGKYNKKDLVKYVTEYFLLRSPKMKLEDIKGYRTVLNENCYLEDSTVKCVKYVFHHPEDYSNCDTVIGHIHRFLILQEKTIEELDKTIQGIQQCCNPRDIAMNLTKIVQLLWDVYKNQLVKHEALLIKIPEWFNCILLSFEDYAKEIDARDVFCKALVKLQQFQQMISDTNTYDGYGSVVKFNSMLDQFMEQFRMLCYIVYPTANRTSMEFVNDPSVHPIRMEDFKKEKLYRFSKSCGQFDSYMKSKEYLVKDDIERVDDFADYQGLDLYANIGEDRKVDVCVAQFLINESNESEIQEAFDGICKEYNSRMLIQGNDSARCYYIINPGVLEVHIKESTPILLSSYDKAAINEATDDTMDIYIESLLETEQVLETFALFSKQELDIKTRLSNLYTNKDFDLECYQIAMEALSLLNVDQKQIDVFTETFTNHRYTCAIMESLITEDEYSKELNEVKRIQSHWKPIQEVPLFIRLEAFEILDAVLEAKPIKKPKVEKPEVGKVNDKNKEKKPVKKEEPEEEEQDEPVKKNKNPFKGINLKSMKLYLEGLKSKFKHMSQKEKELSRNIDNSFRRLVKGMKDSLVSDRREAIIKGSVIPSFSRCMKIAVGLAGTGLVSGNPVIPLMLAIGGFAASKRLTQKERVLLLDEIETELDVVEKEISNAESRNQMKKYRTLLKYKKDLQRQYQRIKYNIRVGKDILPGSAVGVKGGDND